MEVVTLIIAVVALVMAVIAFQRTGGIQDLRRQVEGLSFKIKTETFRDRTADALDRLERLIRGKEKAPTEVKEPDESEKREGGNS